MTATVSVRVADFFTQLRATTTTTIASYAQWRNLVRFAGGTECLNILLITLRINFHTCYKHRCCSRILLNYHGRWYDIQIAPPPPVNTLLTTLDIYSYTFFDTIQLSSLLRTHLFQVIRPVRPLGIAIRHVKSENIWSCSVQICRVHGEQARLTPRHAYFTIRLPAATPDVSR